VLEFIEGMCIKFTVTNCHVSVVFFCHRRHSQATRFILRAQDKNMTNGDFAFFTYGSSMSTSTMRPWERYVDDPAEWPYRQRAYYAVKQVR